MLPISGGTNKKTLYNMKQTYCLLEMKVHRSKGIAFFIVFVLPSKNKVDNLRNKKYISVCIFKKTFFSICLSHPLNKIFVLILKNTIVQCTT
jgi:hypothetical protein